MYRIAQENLIVSRQHQLRVEADTARLVSRINRQEPRIEERARALSLRMQPAR